ncbi:MAG: nitrite reductase small subunit NirD [Oleiphilaceae bacterium]|nr:nitrite reductase small subunit NirD [Oleiphilaceae bacterium]
MSIEHIICDQSDLIKDSGVCALVDDKQIAIFYLPRTEQKLFAIGNYDPIGKANVLSRGIVGDISGQVVVASPLYKQHFNLATGECLEEADVKVPVYKVALNQNKVVLTLPAQ